MDKETRLRMKREYKEICEELDKIIEYIKEDDEIQGNTSKMSASKALDKSKTVRLQVAEIYKGFYYTCLEKTDSNFQKKMCESDYKLFYPIYIKTTSPVYQKLISDTKKESKHPTYEVIRKILKDRITQGKSSFRKAISDYYEKYPDNNKRLKFGNCSTSGKENKKLCLKIEYTESKKSEQKINNIIKPAIHTTLNMRNTIITNKNQEGYKVHFNKKILTSFKKIYLTLYQFLLALIFTLPVGISMIIFLGFFYQLFTDFSVIVRTKQLMVIIVPISFAILFSCFRIGLDFNRFEDGKCVPSKLTKFLLYPFFKLSFIIVGKYINIFEDNIVMHPSENKKNVVVSKYTAKCPICESKGKKNMLRLKVKKGLTVGECESEHLHTFLFDKETLKGNLIEIKDLIYMNCAI